MLLNRVADSFKAEAGNTDDVSAALFGREAEQGVRLLQLLDRQYALVVTNPPYMGSKNMDTLLKKYVDKHYPSGKRDLYAAFILRCLELCRPRGRVAMVTMQNWMFLRGFTDLRALSEQNLIKANNKKEFLGLLRETNFELLAHLGPNSFEEISGEIVQSVMFILFNQKLQEDHMMRAFRLVRLRSAQEKAEQLKSGKTESRLKFIIKQKLIVEISGSIIAYHLPEALLELLHHGEAVKNYGYASWGVSSSDNDRFLRQHWEVPYFRDRWASHIKGGGYCKWYGLDYWAVEWRNLGIAIKSYIIERYPYLGNNSEIKVRSYTVGSLGWTFSSMVGKGLAVRKLLKQQITNDKSPAIFSNEENLFLGGFLNSIVSTFLLRGLSPTMNVNEGYVAALPVKKENSVIISNLVELAIAIKQIVIGHNIIEHDYMHSTSEMNPNSYYIQALLHAIEGLVNTIVIEMFVLSKQDVEQIEKETGTPAGWYPLIVGYDAKPTIPTIIDLPALPQALSDYLAKHERIKPDVKELARLKVSLRMFYETGPGARNVEQEEIDEKTEDNGDQEDAISDAQILIPTETFLEDLSVKMQLHPISVYWLLEELKVEGARCKPEEQRLLEDRLSVLILRLLGHRWPKQIEAGEPLPAWSSSDGIIPIVAGTGETTLAEQVRTRLRAEDGELRIQETEALLTELTGLSLEEWLRRKFFSRHVSQFKHRPIAWHLVSIPTNNGKKKRSGSQRSPAFECLLYYHACSGDALARIRTQYVEPLLRAERQKMQDASLFEDETTSVLANERIQELEAFVEKLRLIEEQGFTCSELDTFMTKEPLDRWSGNGYLAPTGREELLRNERVWHVDINDGVRVNIAPLQLAGVLVSDVLKVADTKKALADRARWRSDERRWVRDGKLPRCGWMDEQVPESPRWTEREPERVAEQIKLEQKRQALQSKHAEEVEV